MRHNRRTDDRIIKSAQHYVDIIPHPTSRLIFSHTGTFFIHASETDAPTESIV